VSARLLGILGSGLYINRDIKIITYMVNTYIFLGNWKQMTQMTQSVLSM